MELVKRQLIVNTESRDPYEKNTIWGGESSGLIQINNVKYTQAYYNWLAQLDAFWRPEKVDLTADVLCYREHLTEHEKKAYKAILCYLTFLDSAQQKNLPVLGLQVTNPEYRLALGQQASMEGIHVQSYQYMLETLFNDNESRNKIYYYYQELPLLERRISYIAKGYQDYLDNPNDENYVKSLIADYALEGLYFYLGFIFFYNLDKRGLMSKHSNIFKLINRDEQLHVELFQGILKEAFKHHPAMKEYCYEFFSEGVRQEVEWNNEILGNSIIGLSESANEEYIKFLCNARMKGVGLKPLYEGVSNPYAHLERIASLNEQTTRGNFFESTVTEYQMPTAMSGWDKI